MLSLKSLGLAFAACICTAAASQSLSNLHGACEVTVDHPRYNLCPLFRDRGQDAVVKVRAELSPTTQLHYEISFGGPLKAQNGEEDDLKCPPGTWICLRKHQVQFEDTEPLFIQVIPIAGDPAIGTPHTTPPSHEVYGYHSTHNGDLEIDFKEIIWRSEPHAAHFRFICDQSAQEPSLPTLTGIIAGIHNFEWSTPHACAKEPLSFSALGENEDTTPPSEEAVPEGDGNQELVDSLPVHHTVRNLMIVLAVASSSMFGLGYLIRYPTPQVRRWVGTTAKKLPFRVGEGVLVQWAQEAMFINDEEDVMVNYQEECDPEEYIPLKPSPTQLSARFMDYGSARR